MQFSACHIKEPGIYLLTSSHSNTHKRQKKKKKDGEEGKEEEEKEGRTEGRISLGYELLEGEAPYM